MLFTSLTLLVLTLIGTAYLVLLSLKDYSVFNGIFLSPFNQLKSYRQVFGSASCVEAFKNTLLLSLGSAAVVFALGTVLSSLIGLTGSRRTSLGLSCAFLILSFLPPDPIYWNGLRLLSDGALTRLKELISAYPLCAMMLVYAWPMIGVSVFAGTAYRACGKGSIAAGALIPAALMLTRAFTPDFYGAEMSVLSGIVGPAVLRNVPLIPDLVFREGLMYGRFAFSSALTVSGLLMDLLPAVGFAALIGFLASKKPLLPASGMKSGSGKPMLAVCAATVLVIAVIGSVLGGISFDAPLLSSLGSSMLVVLLIIIFGGVLFGSWFALSDRMSRKTVLPFIIAVWAFILLSVFKITDFLIVRGQGLVNSRFAIAFDVLTSSKVLIMLVLCTVLSDGSPSVWLVSAIAMVLFTAAESMTRCFGTVVYIIDAGKFPLAAYLREYLNDIPAEGFSSSEVRPAYCTPATLINALAAFFSAPAAYLLARRAALPRPEENP